MAQRPVPPDTPATINVPAAIATPTLGPGGTFSVACRARIAADPRACLGAVLDAPAYPQWNRFCRSCTLNPEQQQEQPALVCGTKFTFDVYMDPEARHGRPTPLEVSVLERFDEEGGAEGGRWSGWRVAWRTCGGWMPGWLLRSERVQEFAYTGDGTAAAETDYVCWETFYGVLAPVVKAVVGVQLERGFQLWTDNLRERVEHERESGEEKSVYGPWENGVGCGRLART